MDQATTEHLAMVMGELEGTPLVRVHSQCLTGDVLGSLRCDCGDQLDSSLAQIGREAGGAVITCADTRAAASA